MGKYDALFSMTLAGDLLAVDPLAFQHHPGRIVFGSLCLLLSLLLTLWKVLRPKVQKNRRERSFGAPFRSLWGLMFPSYKGGGSSAGSADLTRSTPQSHRNGRSRAGSATLSSAAPASHRTRLRDLPRAWIGSLPNPSYKGGASSARNADLTSAAPASHKRAGSQGRYGSFRFPLPMPFYRGGTSRAKNADLTAAPPVSHRTRWRDLPRAWMGYLPLPSYKGGASRARNADLTAQAPERYRGGNTPGQQPLEAPAPSYKGSFAPVKEFFLLRHAPQSRRQRFSPSLSGGALPSTVDSYKGGYGVAGVGKPLQEVPLSYREPWGSPLRYGLASLPRMDGSPTPTLRGLIEPPLSYKEPWGRKRRYGFISLPRMDGSPTPKLRGLIEPPPSYKEPWGRKRRYGFISLPRMDGSPTPKLRGLIEPPPSYKEPWGSRRRYGFISLPRMDGSPTPTMRGLVELPPSYKEPWRGMCTHPRGLGLWQNPDTGEVYIEHMSDKKRFGTSRYGGKLYGMRSQTYFKYHKPEAPDISEVLH